MDKEGYFCYINDHIHLYGEEETGVYWGTRTLLQILNQNGYKGDITIEGYHDPVYCGDRENDGQKMSLLYLRNCCKDVSGD